MSITDLAARSSFTDADAMRVVVEQVRAIDRVRNAEENLSAAHTPTARAALQLALDEARAHLLFIKVAP